MLSSKHQEMEVAMSKRLKCPECGTDQSSIRYVQRTTEYHYVDQVSEDDYVELGGIDDYTFWFNCTECDHNFDSDGKSVDLHGLAGDDKVVAEAMAKLTTKEILALGRHFRKGYINSRMF